MLSLAGLVLVAFNQRPAVASIPPVLGKLGLHPTAQSLLVTIPVLCFGLGALAGPRLRRALGEERAVFLLVFLLAVSIGLRAVFLGWTMFPTTIVIGLSIGVLNVLTPSYIKRRFPDHPGPTTSAYVASATLGPALAAGLTVPVLRAAGGSVHIALGFWMVPAVVALCVWAPQLLVGRPPLADRRPPTGGFHSPIWKRSLSWQVMLYMGIGSLIFYGPLSWLPAIYQSRGVDAATAGYLLLVMNFLGMFGSLLSPLFAGGMRDQRPIVVIGAVVTLAGFLGLLLAPNNQAYYWMTILGIGQGSQFGLALLFIVIRAADGAVAARLSSMAQSGGYLIAATGPFVMGSLHSLTGGWVVPIVFLIVVTIVGLFVGYAAGRDRVIEA